MMTFGEKMRVLRKLRELEFGMLDRGATPLAAADIPYRRAVEYYDRQWPNDELFFRDTLLRLREKKMARAIREANRRADSDL